MRAKPTDAQPPWLSVVGLYLVASAVGHLVWETLQISLYTIWRDGTAVEIAFAIAHCTGGDMLIAAATLVPALLAVGLRPWLEGRGAAFVAIVVAGGMAYTVFSEWRNVEVLRSWAYTDLMPRLPWLGTGLSPLLQWLIVPSVVLWWVRNIHRKPDP